MQSLSELIAIAKAKPVQRLVIAAADDTTVLKAAKDAVNKGFISPLLVGNKQKILDICKQIDFDKGLEIIDEPDSGKSCYKAVDIINEGKADILMKGLVTTATLLKAVLDKNSGIVKNNLLSHFALFESKYYHKLFGVTDVAMNIAPTFEEKVSILSNAVVIMHTLGNNNPKVALLAPVETVNTKIESTVHASMLTMMNKRNQIKGCIVDGPLSLDNAVSHEASVHKGIISDVAGDADILMVPELNSGNILYKSLIFLGGASTAAVITGAKVPIVLTSRADSEETKLLSIAFAAALK
jgi:phosphate butyryltransferase